MSSATNDTLAAAIAERDAAHQAWLAATSPPTRGNVTAIIDRAKADTVGTAWNAWAAACQRVGEFEE